MRKYYLYITISLISLSNMISAQVGIGDAVKIEKGVVLDISSPDHGLLLPTMSLLSRTEYTPLQVAPPTGTLIFNTRTFGSFPNEVYKGLYWWDNEITTWMPFALDVKNYTIKYVNTDITTNLFTDAYVGVPLFGKFEFSDVPSEFKQISTSEIQFNSGGLYSIAVNLDMYTALTDPIGIKVQILKNNLSTATTTRYITSQRTEDYFSGNFTEYLDIQDGDIIKIQAMKATNLNSTIRLNVAGTSSVTISRIR